MANQPDAFKCVTFSLNLKNNGPLYTIIIFDCCDGLIAQKPILYPTDVLCAVLTYNYQTPIQNKGF